jgi:ammonium transporter, Amt family
VHYFLEKIMQKRLLFRFTLRFVGTLATIALFFALAPKIFGQTSEPPKVEDVKAIADETKVAVNIMWMMVCAFLVFFMQAGFALVEVGFTRAKNAAHTMAMNMLVFAIGAFGYWLTGFAFQFGAVNHAYSEVATAGAVAGAWAHSPVTLGDWSGLLDSGLRIGDQIGIIGTSGFMLTGLTLNTGILGFFIFQMVFMDTAATIPTGSTAERIKWSGFCLMGLWVSMFMYPLIGNWVWGGGWLQNLGRIAGFGNGAVDFAGSGVVHMTGGVIGLVGALVMGPRIGRFNKDGSPNTIPAHNLPFGILGTVILFFGWFGFNPGSSLGFTGSFGQLAANAAANTLVAGALGGITAMCYMWFISPVKKPDPAMSVNGMLAGLVAITAPCAFVNSIDAAIIGGVAGVLVCLATVWLEKAKIDDPVGAVPVHFVNGMWGVLAVGLFANGLGVSAGWNGMSSAVTGLFYGGGVNQLIAQVFEAVAVTVAAGGLSYIFFKVIDGMKLLRVSPDVEVRGLDIPEMGVHGYFGDESYVPGTPSPAKMPGNVGYTPVSK